MSERRRFRQGLFDAHLKAQEAVNIADEAIQFAESYPTIFTPTDVDAAKGVRNSLDGAAINLLSVYENTP